MGSWTTMEVTPYGEVDWKRIRKGVYEKHSFCGEKREDGLILILILAITLKFQIWCVRPLDTHPHQTSVPESM